MAPAEQKMDAEKTIKRNPHADFPAVQASRPRWDESKTGFHYTQPPNPNWTLGSGANDTGEARKKREAEKYREVEPYEDGRSPVQNYKLLISAIVPRPIGFVSTRSKDGTSTNLAPFSYTQIVNHDPPIFVVGYAGGFDRPKDSLTNVAETGECVINIISEHFLEAANATSINAPYGTSEWALSGLTPKPCTHVAASRVGEAVFSVECKLLETREWESRATPGKKTGVTAIFEGVKFWIRDDAVNADASLVDPAVLRPMARLGGITYARTVEGVEIPRPDFDEQMELDGAKELLTNKVDGQ